MHTVKRQLMKLRRSLFGLRAYVPSLRERHRLEAMVGPLGFWDKLQRYQLNVLQQNGMKPEHTLMDIGCGPLQGGVAFIKYLDASHYVGIDRDPVRLQAAHSQIADHDLAAKRPKLILSSDFGASELDGATFDFMWASQILYYFDESKMTQLLAMVANRLSRNGKFLGDIIGPEHYEFRSPECGWMLHTVDTVQQLGNPYNLQVRSLGPIVKYDYPQKLSLHSNLLLEITRKG